MEVLTFTHLATTRLEVLVAEAITEVVLVVAIMEVVLAVVIMEVDTMEAVAVVITVVVAEDTDQYLLVHSFNH